MRARLLGWGRLLRLSLAPSALADGAAGLVLGASSWPSGPAPWLLLLASACVYHGGMALNDWADREEDARLGRGRPLQLGTVSPSSALAAAGLLLLAGPLVAALAAPRCALLLGPVALCAALYDLVGRGALRGPLLLAACRAGNLAGGLALASTVGPFEPAHLAAPFAYGLYVFLVSRLALLEDAEPVPGGPRPVPRVVAMSAGLTGIGLVGTWLASVQGGSGPTLPGLLPLVLALLGSLGLWRSAFALRTGPGDAGAVQRVAGMGLRRLLVASACLALGAGTRDAAWVALAILGGYPLSHGLRRVFPPT